MQFLTFITLAAVLFMTLLCADQVEASRSSHRPRNLESLKPASELGWKVPLLSGTHALPLPAADKTLKYLTIGRGTLVYECGSPIPGDDQPAYVSQFTDLYDVLPLAEFLSDAAALHSVIPQFCAFDYADLRNTSMHCVGQIYSKLNHNIVNLFGFNVPEFTIEITWAIPSPAGPTVNGYWGQSATIDKDWEVYRVETAGGVVPKSCKGHENSTINVAYAAEYWFFHR